MNIPPRLILLPLLVATLGASGCGGGGDDGVTLSGTAATGVALDGTVTVVDADGRLSSAPIGIGGTFSVATADNPPFMLAATSTDGATVLYSWAAAGGTVNITPLTSVAMVQAAGLELGNLFASWADDHDEITGAEIDAAIAVVNANLRGYYQAHDIDFSTYDFFGDRFDTDGTGFDGILDDVQVSIRGTTVALTQSGTGEPIGFQGDIDTSEIHLGGGTWDGSDSIPSDSVWQLSVTNNISGQSVMPGQTLTGTELPTSEADLRDFVDGFVEGNVANAISSTGGGTIRFDVTELTITRNVAGNVGDTITCHFAGTLSVTGVPGVPDVIDQPIDSDCRWERISNQAVSGGGGVTLTHYLYNVP